jgi:hypothetical protein
MTIDQTRAQVISSVWQAIAQSGVDLSSIPLDQQEKLVGKVADQLMQTLDALLDEVASPPDEEDAQPAVEGEQILWRGRPFLSLVETYTITTERIKIIKGLLGRGIENFELVRIQDIDYSQGLTERMLGIGDITIRGSDESNPKIELRNIHDPEQIYELLRKAWLEARKRHGLQFREFM